MRGKVKQHGRKQRENFKVPNSTKKLRTENNSLDNTSIKSMLTSDFLGRNDGDRSFITMDGAMAGWKSILLV